MANYKAYPEYKDSGVEWLGEVPSCWNIKRLGQFFDERRNKVSDKEYPPLSVTMLGIVPQIDTAAKSDAGDNRKLVLKNDFVINSRSDRKGSSGVSQLVGSVSLISIVMKPQNINPKFAHYLLRSYPFQEEFYRHGKGIVADLWSTNASEMKNILIPELLKDESEVIANFLDHETAKINTLIDKQQQLIELLKEKRQAVISHAVTKGLNPDVPMKDSGVEWLGEVPEHWDTLAISHLFTRIKRTGYNNKELLSVYRDYGVIPKSSRDDNNNKPSEDLSPYQLVKPNDLVMNKMKAWQGSIAISECEGIVSPAYFVYTPKDKLFELALPKYVHYLLRNSLYVTQYLSRSKGIRINQWDLDPDEFRCIELLLPTKEEQLRIFRFLDYTTTTIDTLIEKQLQQIELLKERRTALISAAVTGKIDVRDWTAPAPQQQKAKLAEEALA
ncbi:restriction endonuclease subunit S [Scandinavium goeteborgense]|uniref:restriction endonuclease subunit S n=1 Tax=Scandinavium goeteborgense TaxID=1851514 RepID=UPI000D7C250C